MWGKQNTNKISIMITDFSNNTFTIDIDLNSDTVGSLKDKYIDEMNKFCSRLTLIEYKQKKYWHNKRPISIDDFNNVTKFEDQLYFKTNLNKKNIKNNIKLFCASPYKIMENDNTILKDYSLESYAPIYQMLSSYQMIKQLLYYRVDKEMNENEKNNIMQQKQIIDAKKNGENLMYGQLFKNFNILNNGHSLQKKNLSNQVNNPNNKASIIDIIIK